MPYKDPLKNSECKRQYSLANKEKETLRLKKYVLENKEKVNLAKRKWRAANKDKQHALSSAWVEVNRGRYNYLHSKRRAAKLNATPKWLTREDYCLMSDYYMMAKELEKVFPWGQQVDHIIPLQGKTVCGLHVPNNLQILSVWQNQTKNNTYSEPQ